MIGGKYAVYAYQGTMTVNGGKISGKKLYTINAVANANIILNNGEIYNGSHYALVSKGTVTINGGKITCEEYNGYAIWNQKKLTINGGTISSQKNSAVYNDKNSNAVINDGYIVSTNSNAVYNYTNAILEVNGGKIETLANNRNAIYSYNNSKTTLNGGKLIATKGYGIIALKDAEVIINKADIESYYFAVCGNGNTTASGAKFTINDGSFISTNAYAVYLPQIEGQTTITGGTFKGNSAIEIRAGKLEISGGEFIATANEFSVNENDNGGTTTGSAISVAQHTTKEPIQVNITGGLYKGVIPFSESNPQGNTEEDVAKITLNISGGQFYNKSTSTDKSVNVEDCTKFIDGGKYTIAPDKKYIKDGYKAYKMGDIFIVIKEIEVVPKNENSTLDVYANEIVEETVLKAFSENSNDILGLTEKEYDNIMENILSGNRITTEVITQNLENPSQEDKKLVEEKHKDILGYYDISVILKVNGEEIAKVKELGKTIKVALQLPENMPVLKEGYERTYSVIRVHNGIVETISKDLTAENGIITIETDKFSTYAIEYKDVKTEEDKNIANPKTMDKIEIYFALVVLTIFSLIIVCKKR